MVPTSKEPGPTEHDTDHTESVDDAARPAADEPARETATLLEQMGGVSGLIYSTLPVVVFVPANMAFGLTGAIIAALVCAVVIFAIRLVRREPLNPAISGLLGVAICAFIAHRTGDAKGYFLFGIWTMLAYAGVFVLSILLRWPLVGVAWNAINGNGHAWRKHRPTLLAYDLATALWAVVFGARYIVQSSLYDTSHTGWLAVARIGMGWPLTAAAVLGTVLLVRRAERDERELVEVEPDVEEAPGLNAEPSLKAEPSTKANPTNKPGPDIKAGS